MSLQSPFSDPTRRHFLLMLADYLGVCSRLRRWSESQHQLIQFDTCGGLEMLV